RQPMFSIGLKGIDPVNTDRIGRLIADTIGSLAEHGIDPLTIDAALNTIEFRLRENNTGAFPRGIAFMFRALRSWLHGRDPFSPLAFERPLAAIKAQVASANRYFEKLLKRHLVDNQHRTELVLKPDSDLAGREAHEERARLEAVRASMTERDLLAVVEATDTLRRIQEQPDPPEALATIPTVGLSDLPRTNKLLPREVTSIA